ncbi:hypothetical protein EDEG_00967 [Edhazardia aedis USNM 41457]|uniref:U3 small nucleolar ribonucleoprotein protein IMP4 n=1 Tax=Edhazardia aedis (strain USNM 41457) TaxID=1003232 RepID=J9DQJ0_EDHAE|nr:hypothetical protein EDEG_00967 [Edhazardia aedis USNM 41457]|eukprot:EJW04830.1 hypothetical protein EDEG_00967 [Edhazardia aedis USNM 41457]
MNRKRRRDYLLQKENEEKERNIAYNKKILKECLATNKKLPHELKTKAPELLQEIFFETNDEIPNIDKLPDTIFPLITTVRDPSDKLKHFARRIAHILNTTTVTRGSLTIKDLESYMERSQFNAIIIIAENRGTPSKLSLCMYPYGPLMNFSLFNIVMSDFKIKGNAYFVSNNMFLKDETKTEETDEDNKILSKNAEAENRALIAIKDIFSRVFSTTQKHIDKNKHSRSVLLARRNGLISFRHYHNDMKDAFEMRLYEVVRGTLEGGEREWVYKPFMNTARKQE